jgi:hypothetical protein
MTNSICSKDYKCTGLWRLPETQGSIEGALFHNQTIFQLDLNGAFWNEVLSEDESMLIDETVKPRKLLDVAWDVPVLFGATSEGEKITVFQNVLRSINPIAHRSIYNVHRLLVGAHIASEEKAAFSSAKCYIEDLAISLGPCSFSAIIKWHETDVHLELHVEESVGVISTTVNTQVSIKWWHIFFSHFSMLLTALHGKPVEILYIDVISPELGQARFRDFRLLPKRTEKPPWICLSDLDLDLFKAVLQNWADLPDRLRLMFTHFGAYVSYPNFFHQLNLVTLAQFLEAFHRCAVGGQILPLEEYEKVKLAMLEAIPADVNKEFRKKLADTLAHAHEYSQRTRLKLLFAVFTEEFQLLFAKKYKRFVGLVVNTRNAYTHFDDTAQLEVMTDNEVSLAVIALEALLNSLLLEKVGVPESLLRSKLKDRQKFKTYTKLKSW